LQDVQNSVKLIYGGTPGKVVKQNSLNNFDTMNSSQYMNSQMYPQVNNNIPSQYQGNQGSNYQFDNYSQYQNGSNQQMPQQGMPGMKSGQPGGVNMIPGQGGFNQQMQQQIVPGMKPGQPGGSSMMPGQGGFNQQMPQQGMPGMKSGQPGGVNMAGTELINLQDVDTGKLYKVEKDEFTSIAIPVEKNFANGVTVKPIDNKASKLLDILQK
jgi:hypothetical protein